MHWHYSFLWPLIQISQYIDTKNYFIHHIIRIAGIIRGRVFLEEIWYVNCTRIQLHETW